MKRRFGTTASFKLGANGLLLCLVFLTIGCTRERSTTDMGSIVSVCQVLADPSSYRGKVVQVRGVFTYRGLREDDCPKEFITGGHRWPPILNLASTEYTDAEELPFGFVTDLQSWEHLDEVAIEAGKRGRPVEIWATIIGQIRAQPDYVLPDGRVRGGYGHLGVLPAEIVVKRVTDVVVKQVAESRYDYRLPKARPR
jgi:hypothetical protein